MKRLVHVLTVAESLRFLRGQPRYMRERGYETHVVCSDGPLLHRFAAQEGAFAHPIQMPRSVTPAADARSLARLVKLLVAVRADVVHAQTPKGGLLGTIAGRAVGTPRVVYHMRGLPYQGARGALRSLLWTTERVACSLAHVVVCQSRSLRRAALADGLVCEDRSTVLGPGGNGVDARRFDPSDWSGAGAALRRDLGIPPESMVVGFVGRLVRDKGIVELTDAWRGLRERFPSTHLVLVGPFESRDPVPEPVRRELETAPRTHIVGEVDDVAPYYALMNVLALPTYREGFPNAPIEAAAMRLPVVATLVDGSVDAVVDGRTGALVPPRSADALERALARYLESPAIRAAHGDAGRAWVLSELQPERIWREMGRVYEDASWG